MVQHQAQEYVIEAKGQGSLSLSVSPGHHKGSHDLEIITHTANNTKTSPPSSSSASFLGNTRLPGMKKPKAGWRSVSHCFCVTAWTERRSLKQHYTLSLLQWDYRETNGPSHIQLSLTKTQGRAARGPTNTHMDTNQNTHRNRSNQTGQCCK